MREATNKFHIAPDKDSISRVHDSLHTLATARQSRIDNQSSTLKSLSRRLNNLTSQANYEDEHHDASAHASEMLRMDTDKFRIAKGVNDAEIEGERLSGELAALQQTLETLEKEGVEGGKRGERESEDAIVLKLAFYRSLGIDVEEPEQAGGEYTRAVVRNSDRGDVNVLEVDGSRSKRHYANIFWESM